jgi:enterochelin esterase family protein
MELAVCHGICLNAAPMKNILAALFLSLTPAFAQMTVSPEVHPDSTVTFRFKAPDAHHVQLHCEGVPNSSNEYGTDMKKGDDGVWTFTTDPLQPDIYGYTFEVDGIQMIDPNNPYLKYNIRMTVSQVEVPGPASTPWQIEDVPHGDLHRHLYKSAIGGDERNFTVYTPPGYDPGSHKRYPVLYLLHGYTDDDTAWAQTGRANIILDNLIAHGQAKPMIVVMPLGYGDNDVLKFGGRIDMNTLWQTNLDRFTDALFHEVMPQVEQEYHAASGPKNTAIAGLSMGGSESLINGLNHLDRFGWIGAFSTGGLSDYPARFPSLKVDDNKKIHLLWIACGHDDGLFKSNRELCSWLDGKGIQYTWVQMPGVHTYRVWRPFLSQFATLLFQDK